MNYVLLGCLTVSVLASAAPAKAPSAAAKPEIKAEVETPVYVSLTIQGVNLQDANRVTVGGREVTFTRRGDSLELKVPAADRWKVIKVQTPNGTATYTPTMKDYWPTADSAWGYKAY